MKAWGRGGLCGSGIARDGEVSLGSQLSRPRPEGASNVGLSRTKFPPRAAHSASNFVFPFFIFFLGFFLAVI